MNIVSKIARIKDIHNSLASEVNFLTTINLNLKVALRYVHLLLYRKLWSWRLGFHSENEFSSGIAFLWKRNIAWNVRKSHGALAFALEFHWFFCFVFLSRKKWKIISRLPSVSRYFFKITVPSNILEVKSAFFIHTNTLCVATKIFPFTIVKPVINQKAHL